MLYFRGLLSVPHHPCVSDSPIVSHLADVVRSVNLLTYSAGWYGGPGGVVTLG